MIRGYLASQGFDVSKIKIEADLVVYDHDGHWEKSALLDEIATGGYTLEPGVDPEGYYYSFDTFKGARTTPQAPRAAKTYFRFAAAVPEAWRNAFRLAAAEWGGLSATDCLGFVEGTGGKGSSQITIEMGETGTAADGSPSAADASYPRLYQPPKSLGWRIVGPRIRIDFSQTDQTDTAFMRGLALHEIGHTLGFTHPHEGGNIVGTARNSNGCCVASYFTVMDYAGTTTLTADDRSSVLKVFAKRRKPTKAGAVLTCDY